MGLEVHPELWAITKIKAESERSVCRNASTIVDDLGNTVWRDANRLCQLILRQRIFCQEFFFQDLARRHRGKLFLDHRHLPSVIIDHSDLIGITIDPFKNDAYEEIGRAHV